jgi:hypothetical protein
MITKGSASEILIAASLLKNRPIDGMPSGLQDRQR